MQNLVEIDGKFYKQEIADKIFELRLEIEEFDLLQLTKKISLNSAYGALLSSGFRWGFEEKIGASVTYTGRAITSHMMEIVCQILSGNSAGLEKSYKLTPDKKVQNIYTTKNSTAIYGDTDSAYFKTGATDEDTAIQVADFVGEELNSTFKPFMEKSFFCIDGYSHLISAGREIVAVRALFQARKKYVAKVINLDGFKVNKIKAMGSEIKKSDTPKVIQQFLKKLLDKILDGLSYEQLSEFVLEARASMFNQEISQSEIILLGASKAANNLDHFTDAYHAENNGKPFKNKKGTGKLTIPGHVRAAINYNLLAEEFDKHNFVKISSGDKVKVFDLLPNDLNLSSMAFPSEIQHFPTWFTEIFHVDIKKSEEKLITSKLESVFECQNLEVPTVKNAKMNSIISF